MNVDELERRLVCLTSMRRVWRTRCVTPRSARRPWLTYAKLSALTGIAQETLRSIGSRVGYNVTLATVERICRALEVPFHDMVEMIDDPPKRKRTTKKRTRR